MGGTGLNGSVLVIDNDELICDALSDILSASGLKVYLAHDGLEGEAVYRDHQKDIDMIILDWRLPRQTGSDTLRNIRRINPQVQVMVSSGYNEEYVVRQIEDQGPVSFLSKPYDIDKLLYQVEKLLA